MPKPWGATESVQADNAYWINAWPEYVLATLGNRAHRYFQDLSPMAGRWPVWVGAGRNGLSFGRHSDRPLQTSVVSIFMQNRWREIVSPPSVQAGYVVNLKGYFQSKATVALSGLPRVKSPFCDGFTNMKSWMIPGPIDDARPTAISRNGIEIQTDQGVLTELSGGSHVACVLHDDGWIVDYAKRRMSEGFFPASGRGFNHAYQIELADLIHSYLDDKGARIFFTSGGTESNEMAMSIAYFLFRKRNQPSRHMVIGREYSYHGVSLLTRNMGHHPVHIQMPDQVNFHWPKLKEPRCSACPLGLSYPSCGVACATQLESYVDEYGADQIAAVIVEPISGTSGGGLVPPPEYLPTLRKICADNDILFIVDETITSFWRTGVPFVTNELRPDMIVGGKCLAAGYAPLSALIVSGDLCDELRSYDDWLPQRLTFTANQTSCLMGLAVQNYIRESGLVDTLDERSERLASRLKQAVSSLGGDVLLHGRGFCWGLSVHIPKGRGHDLILQLRQHSRERKIELMSGLRAEGDGEGVHVCLTPPFDLTDHEVNLVVEHAVAAGKVMADAARA